LHLRAVIAQDEGRQSEAEALIRDALAREPENPLYWNTLGNGLLAQGRSDEAVVAFTRAHDALPDQADILFNLANAERAAGLLKDAVDSYQETIAKAPGHVGAYNNLALVLKASGDVESAATVLIEAIAQSPKSAELRFNLGNALHAAGRLEAAEAAYRKAIELSPNHADAHANLGAVLADAGEKAGARTAFERAIALNPNLVPAYVGLADLADDGSRDAVAHRRAVLALNPKLAPVRSSLLMCMQYAPVGREALFEAHQSFGATHARSDRAYASAHVFDPKKRLKLGIVSGDFRFHAMLFFALPLFEARDGAEIELYCYSNTARPDRYTQDFRAAADHWRDVRSLSDEDLTALIVRDGIDVLVDLSGHAPHNRLLTFAARPAPLQIAWGDYVDTRGLPAIDFLFGDPIHTPASEDRYFVERVERFAADYICYQAPPYTPPVASTPALTNNDVTFGSFSEVTKIGPASIARWAAVLKAIPSARFLLNGYLFADGARTGRILSMFMDAGIDPSRVQFETGGMHPDFLAQYAQVDVILDTTPYSGGLTTCEALLMGVPVLTVKGERFCARHAEAHLINGGYPEGVAASEDELIEKARALASNPESLNAARLGRRKVFLASPLCDVEGFAQNFYGAVRKAWIDRCAKG
ncbi:MAG: O-linked N-acetylglucosamine transferase, SPINDLY family protein, partial [Candidatus Binataceae bacterium]